MNRRVMLVVFLILVLLVFWGCEKSPTGTDFDTDEDAITQMIMDNPEGYFSYDDHYGEDDTTSTKDSKASRYIIWWRQPTDLDRYITVNVVNDSAYVTFSGEVTGNFNLLVYDTIPPDTIINYPKPLNDNFIRYAIFRRSQSISEYRGWYLYKISGVSVNSDSNTVNIDSVRIQSTSYPDTVLKDPLQLVNRGDILSFAAGEEVNLTVYVDDSVYTFLHARGHRLGYCRWWRWRFNYQGNDIWTGTWITPLIPGIRMAAFDILHKNTLDDNHYQYDSNVWIFPYRVEL